MIPSNKSLTISRIFNLSLLLFLRRLDEVLSTHGKVRV